jgi:uncharacterized protein
VTYSTGLRSIPISTSSRNSCMPSHHMWRKSRTLIFLCCLVACLPLHAGEIGASLVTAARAQVGVTVQYDPSYVVLAYPNGDVPSERGVCCDVIIRALRQGQEKDLQKLVHEDMAKNFSLYPRQWSLSRPDKNIDHRRVPNLQTYFKRSGMALAASKTAADYQPGDIVTCTVPPNLPHIMIVSDKKTAEGEPLIIHNIGAGAREEAGLFRFPLTGHYRWK